MSLSKLIRPGELRRAATLTVATLLTPVGKAEQLSQLPECAVVSRTQPAAPAVATVATVTVASARVNEPDPFHWPESCALSSADFCELMARVNRYVERRKTEPHHQAMSEELVIRERLRDGKSVDEISLDFVIPAESTVKIRDCSTCANQTRRKTCKEPIEAGLSDHLEIFFVDMLPESTAGCSAFKAISHR
jgi:hypothetical protein